MILENCSMSLRQRFSPSARAATWLWWLFLLLALLSLFTGWASLPVTLFLQLLLSFAAGFLAAWFERQAQPETPRYRRAGALAGLYLPLTTAVVITLVALAAGFATFGALLPLMIPYFAVLPMLLALGSLLGAGGAQVFSWCCGLHTPATGETPPIE